MRTSRSDWFVTPYKSHFFFLNTRREMVDLEPDFRSGKSDDPEFRDFDATTLL